MKSFLISVVLIGLAIWATYEITPRPYVVHYHANMAVYIDGKKWDFSGNQYMEEVERCNVMDWVLPNDRIHLHENKWDVIHVHMAASTWWHLFSNLYWNFGSGYLFDDVGGEYRTGSGKNLYYFVNGERVDNPHNRIVESEDRLVIWYGTGTSEEIASKLPLLVANTAREYNEKPDPASCSVNETLWLLDRIKELLPHSHEE